MVYCGKPSANCASCRAKRRQVRVLSVSTLRGCKCVLLLQCDRAIPTCSQCKRSGDSCPGYRGTSHFVFRNETNRVIARSKTRVESQGEVTKHGVAVSAASRPTTGLMLNSQTSLDNKIHANCASSRMDGTSQSPTSVELIQSDQPLLNRDWSAGSFANFGYDLTPTDWLQDSLPSSLKLAVSMSSPAAGFGDVVNPLTTSSPSLDHVEFAFSSITMYPSPPALLQDFFTI